MFHLFYTYQWIWRVPAGNYFKVSARTIFLKAYGTVVSTVVLHQENPGFGPRLTWGFPVLYILPVFPHLQDTWLDIAVTPTSNDVMQSKSAPSASPRCTGKCSSYPKVHDHLIVWLICHSIRSPPRFLLPSQLYTVASIRFNRCVFELVHVTNQNRGWQLYLRGPGGNVICVWKLVACRSFSLESHRTMLSFPLYFPALKLANFHLNVYEITASQWHSWSGPTRCLPKSFQRITILCCKREARSATADRLNYLN